MSASEQVIASPLEEPSRRRRQLLSGVIYLLFIATGVFVVLPQFLGEDRERIGLALQSARPEWLALAVAFETLRYLCFGMVVRRIGSVLDVRISRADSAQMMLASYALSRIFSLGGATAFIVRLQFWMRRGLTVGRTLGLMITHNVLSGAALLCAYLIGMAVLWVRGDLEQWKALAAFGWLLVICATAGVQVYFGLRPQRLERVAAWWLQRFDTRLRRIFKRAFYRPEFMQQLSHDLALSLNTTLRSGPGLLSAAFYQATGLAADIFTLYLCAHALQIESTLGLLIAAYIIAYYSQLIAPTPGEAGAMEGTLLVTLLALGFERADAFATMVLFRLLSFWLPIPFGVLAYLNLRRTKRL